MQYERNTELGLLTLCDDIFCVGEDCDGWF